MKKIKIFIGLALVSLIVSGCSVSVNSDNDTSKIDGGVFVSTDKGATWNQTVSVPTIKRVDSIRGFDASFLAFDPNDSKAVYFGTVGNGLYYSYDLSRGWQKAYSLPDATVSAAAVSPDDKCLVYAAIGNKLYQSKDCSRTFEEIYFDSDTSVLISSLAIDHYDSDKIYIGTSKGDILKSLDRGSNWQNICDTGFKINKLVLDPSDSRVILAATAGAAVFRSKDSGASWESLKENLKEHKGTNSIIDVVFAPSEKGAIFAVISSGIFKSADYGDSWSKLELITKENQKESSIEAMAVNPKDAGEIYYSTRTTFYSSADGGATWKTKKLPSTRAGKVLLIKPDEPNVIFMGMKTYSSGQGIY